MHGNPIFLKEKEKEEEKEMVAKKKCPESVTYEDL